MHHELHIKLFTDLLHLTMAKYFKQERLRIGREICESGMTFIEAGIVYGFSDETARRYQLFYEQYSGVDHHSGRKIPPKPSAEVLAKEAEPLEAASEYENMSKEQLIQELMKSKVREARLKKGYMVKGVGANKEFVPLNNKSIK